MKSRNFLIEMAILFAATCIIYLLVFLVFEKRRNTHGGWEILFEASPGNPALVSISQPHLGISNVNLKFDVPHTISNVVSEKVIFNSPHLTTPFGKVIVLDTRYLPGTIVLNLFSNEVQVLPRILTINDIEYPWVSGTNLVFSFGTNPPMNVLQYKRKR
jgi:hypothetical protein